jgi:hypothetical protein
MMTAGVAVGATLLRVLKEAPATVPATGVMGLVATGATLVRVLKRREIADLPDLIAAGATLLRVLKRDLTGLAVHVPLQSQQGEPCCAC